MGSEMSQERIDQVALQMYEQTLERPCLLPDVAIEDSLLRFSGTDSNAMLRSVSSTLIQSGPAYIEKLGSGLGVFLGAPNAVGLGALMIFVFLDILAKSQQADPNLSEMIRGVFAEEKGSAVRNTMTEYIRLHQRFLKDEPRLLQELSRSEIRLSSELTVLRNSLLYEGQMTSRGFKIWVNGAFFHCQMLIHEARLKSQYSPLTSDQLGSIEVAIHLYLNELDTLMEKYKAHKISTTTIRFQRKLKCYLADDESTCKQPSQNRLHVCTLNRDLVVAYVKVVFSNFQPISRLREQFADIKNNLYYKICQHDSFSLQ